MVEPSRWADAAARAKCKTATSELADWVRECEIDMVMEPAVEWSLVKGKTFVKLLWNEHGFEPHLVQPEYMAVLREDITDLDRQEAFVQSMYIGVDDFDRLVQRHSNAEKLRRDVRKSVSQQKDGDAPDQAGYLRQIVLGGMNPYQAASASTSSRTRGVVDWMQGPQPVFDAKLMSQIVRLDELWVKDSARGDDWTTIQVVGNVVVFGDKQQTNAFADMEGLNPELAKDSKNPLRNQHPYIEFCPNPLDGYFWGRSELCNVGLLQEALNARVNGINKILRRQEEPPRAITGSSSANQDVISRLNKPGGWFADSSPTTKIETLKEEVPAGLYESMREILEWFNDMAGFTPTMAGRGETGVRSAAQSETLVRTSSPRFKDRAILVERSVERVGGLMVKMLQAFDADKLMAWVGQADQSLETAVANADNVFVAPIEGMKPIEFQWWHLPEKHKVKVDSHSSSPAFSHEARQILFDFAKVGAITPTELVERVQPPGADSIINALERKQAAQEKFMAQHPEIAAKAMGGGGGRKR